VRDERREKNLEHLHGLRLCAGRRWVQAVRQLPRNLAVLARDLFVVPAGSCRGWGCAMTARNPENPDEIILDLDDLAAWDLHTKQGKDRRR
jgi:hypothetical protein